MEVLLTELYRVPEVYAGLQEQIATTIQGRICHHHVKILNVLVKLFSIHRYLEIGVHNGTSMSYVVNQSVRPLSCIGVDLFSHTTQRYKHDKLQQERTLKNIESLNTSKSSIHLIKGDSRAAATYEQVAQVLQGQPVDLLFIDGDHEFAGVESDFLMYSGLVRPGGFIVFDDANTQYPGILKCVEKHVRNSPRFRVVGLYENTDLIVQKL